MADNDKLNKGNNPNDQAIVPSGGNQVGNVNNSNGNNGNNSNNSNGANNSGKQALAKIDLAKAVSTEVKKPTDGGRVNGIDTGLACLIAIAKYYNIPAEYRQLERAYVLEEGSVDMTTLVRAARDLKLKARAYDNLHEKDLKAF